MCLSDSPALLYALENLLMEANIPKTSVALAALLRADFTTQWRNRRSLRLVLILPIVILISWKGLVEKMGGGFVLSSCITIGVISIGLMGYSNTIARDRDRGIFQRLRVSPINTWTIMASRLIVQIAMILIMTVLIFVVGSLYDGIILPPLGYLVCLVMTILGGALYLSLGQAIVGRIHNPETVNSTSRLVYFAFILIGMLGQFGTLGKTVELWVDWSPYGVVQKVLDAGLRPMSWGAEASLALLLTIIYTVVLATLGIRWFKWESKNNP